VIILIQQQLRLTFLFLVAVLNVRLIMSQSSSNLHKDVLFVGLTRVPMIMGVPYAAFVAEIMVMAIEHVMSGNPLYLACVVPIHGILYLISAHDPGVFAEIAAWSKTTSRCRNGGFWGMASFSPVTVNKWLG